METVIKSYLGFFFVCITLIVGVNLLNTSIQARNANLEAENYVQAIEASNIADSVIDACKTDAASKGYTLTYKPVIASGNNKYGTIVLEYEYKLPLFGVTSKKNIVADVN